MLLTFYSLIKDDSLLSGSSLFAVIFLGYFIVMKVHVSGYRIRHDAKPIHYKFFRLYAKSLITNSPSKSEKKFYATTNRMTFFFNSLLIATFAVLMVVWMK